MGRTDWEALQNILVCWFPRSPWAFNNFINVSSCLNAQVTQGNVTWVFLFNSTVLVWLNLAVEGRDEMKEVAWGAVYKISAPEEEAKGYSTVAVKCQKVALAGAVFRLSVVWVGTGPGSSLPGLPSVGKPHMLGLQGSEVCPLYSSGVRVIWKKWSAYIQLLKRAEID